MTIFNVLIEWVYALSLPLVGVVLARGLLWYMDRAINFGFVAWLKEADHNAKAVYFGARFVGVCLLIGLALS